MRTKKLKTKLTAQEVLHNTMTYLVDGLGLKEEQIVCAIADFLSDAMPSQSKDNPEELVVALQSLRRAEQKLREATQKGV